MTHDSLLMTHDSFLMTHDSLLMTHYYAGSEREAMLNVNDLKAKHNAGVRGTLLTYLRPTYRYLPTCLFKLSYCLLTTRLPTGTLNAIQGVINAIKKRTQNPKIRIPLRDSPVTRLLSDAFGGDSHMVLIGTVSPTDSSLDETMHTMSICDSSTRCCNSPSRAHLLSEGGLLNTPARCQSSP